MSRNLKAYMLEDVRMSPAEILGHLSQQVPGRSIGERYVVAAKINDKEDLELELDDGSRYAFQCRSIN